MVEYKVRRPQGERGRHHIRRGRRKTPWSRKFSAEEHSAVQLDSAQNLGECIHSILWTFCKSVLRTLYKSVLRTVCKVPWPPRKGICFRKPSEQIMATLGHVC